ncbi:MAG: hypothetical protein R3B95_13225 [Nitrospirales bacterium]|nr:hypothetical protein [Nitrospirales bacterium]
MLLLLFTFAYAESIPSWWGNEIGKEPIVLPGFTPVMVDGQSVKLGMGRTYTWDDSFVPRRMIARNQPLVTDSRLIISVNKSLRDISDKQFQVIEQTDHHVIIKVTARVEALLEINVTSRIEYDGLAMINVELIPINKAVHVDELYYSSEILKSEWTKLLAYKPDTTHLRLKQVVFEPSYDGEFLNATALTDGQRSFWWFADHADGWNMTEKKATKVIEHEKSIYFQQNIIDRPTELAESRDYQFNLLVTPVKSGNGNVRSHRSARRIDQQEAAHHGVHTWWTTAFVHQLLPYSYFPEGIKKKLPKKDQEIYAGPGNTKALIQRSHKIGIDRLPYFSAHALNRYDPSYVIYREVWKVNPEMTLKGKYDNPYSATRDDSILTHRADGYTDYLLHRFSELVDEVEFEGLYFDQGGVVPSSNPLNGQWYDADGGKHGATDILALRDFHKRLATMLHQKGKKGLIFSHNSNTAIVPAYTFVTAMVQGEGFNHWLKNYDYIDSITLDEVRSRLGSAAFGVPTLWLEVIWADIERLDQSSRRDKMTREEWITSDTYNRAYKNFMALALLHDMPTLSLAPIENRNEVFLGIDWVEPENAKFVGYWAFDRARFRNSLYHSYYVSEDGKKLLLIFSNLGNERITIDFDQIEQYLTDDHRSACRQWTRDKRFISEKASIKTRVVEPKTFFLLPAKCSIPSSPENFKRPVAPKGLRIY